MSAILRIVPTCLPCVTPPCTCRRYTEYKNFCKAMNATLQQLLVVPMSSSAIETLLRQEMPSVTHEMTPATLAVITNVSQGNPFLLWKIVKFAKESNADDINSVVECIRDNSLIIFMLDNVPEKQRMILKAASVIGESFDMDILEEVTPRSMTTSMVRSLCVSLSRKGLLVNAAPDVFSFASPLIRKFVYDLIPKRCVRTHDALLDVFRC